MITGGRHKRCHESGTVIYVTAEVSRNRRVGVCHIGILNHTMSVNRVEETHSVNSHRGQDGLVMIDIVQSIRVGVACSDRVGKNIHSTGEGVASVVCIIAHKEAAQMMVRIDFNCQNRIATIRQNIGSSRHEMTERSVAVHILVHGQQCGGKGHIHGGVAGDVVERVGKHLGVVHILTHHLDTIDGNGSHMITSIRNHIDGKVATGSHGHATVRCGSSVGTGIDGDIDGRSNTQIVERDTVAASRRSGLDDHVVNTAGIVVENIVNVVGGGSVRESLMLVDNSPVGRSRRGGDIDRHVLGLQTKSVIVIRNHILAGRDVDTRRNNVGSGIVIIAECIGRRTVHNRPHQRIGVAGTGDPTALTHHNIGEVLEIRQGERGDETDIVNGVNVVGRVAVTTVEQRHRKGIDGIREVGTLCKREGSLLARGKSRRGEGLRHRSTAVDGITGSEGGDIGRGVVVLHREGDRHVAQVAIVIDTLDTDEVEVSGEDSLIDLDVIDVSIVVSSCTAFFLVLIHEENDTARVMAFEGNREGLVGGTRRHDGVNRSVGAGKVVQIGDHTHLEHGRVIGGSTSSGLEADSGICKIHIKFGKYNINITGGGGGAEILVKSQTTITAVGVCGTIVYTGTV